MKDERAKLARRIDQATRAKALIDSGHWEIIQDFIDTSKKYIHKVIGNGVDTFEEYREYVGKLSVLEVLEKYPEQLIKKGEVAKIKMQKYEEPKRDVQE
jgi:hypothetical protein